MRVKPGLAAAVERVGLAADVVIGLPAPYPGPYMDAWIGVIRARALISAVRVGLFDALPGTTGQLAKRTRCDPQRLEVLLEALRAMRYVRLRRATWRATRRSRTSFGASARMPLKATVGSLTASNYDVLQGLDDVLRGYEPPGLHDSSTLPEVWDGYQAAMIELNAMVAGPTLAALAQPRRLLDIGGGPGSFAIAACRRWPEAEVVIADLPQAAALGRPRVAAAGLDQRISYIEGDARGSDLGRARYDAVTMLNVIHNVDRNTGVALLRAAANAAGPQGTVTVLEIEGTRTLLGTMASLTFCAWMGSRAWTGAQLSQMATDAGLRDVRLARPARLLGNVLLQGRGL